MSLKPYDVFVSYAEADRAWVEGFCIDALIGAAARVLTQGDFTLGAAWTGEFERAVASSERVLLVISSAYFADMDQQFVERLSEYHSIQAGDSSVIVLLLENVQLRPGLHAAGPWKAFTESEKVAAVRNLGRLLKTPLPESLAIPCPYPGMRPFTEKDRRLFFGRAREVKELLYERLLLHPFVVVIGRSGTGKSSLVSAGLLPALQESKSFNDDTWSMVSFRPGVAPLETFQSLVGKNVNPIVASQDLLHKNGTQRLLLVVDQFEEMFTLAGSNQEAIDFQTQLQSWIGIPNCFVVLTVRADFYQDLMSCPLWPQLKANFYEVLPLDRDNLEEAITEPAKSVRVFLEPTLVERLLADAAGEPGVLPLIQETMVLLWGKLQRRFLSAAAYEALGQNNRTGLQVAIATSADEAMRRMPSNDHRSMARRIFLRLVQFGEGRPDTRRQQRESQLRDDRDDQAQFDVTLGELVRARLLVPAEGEKHDALIDIAHERLISAWPEFQKWLRESRAAEVTRRRMESKAEEWVRLGGVKGGLLDEVELKEVEAWMAQGERPAGVSMRLMDLVRASRREIERQKRAAFQRRTIAWIGGAIVLIVLSGLGFTVRNNRIIRARNLYEAAVTALQKQDALGAEILLASSLVLDDRKASRTQLIDAISYGTKFESVASPNGKVLALDNTGGRAAIVETNGRIGWWDVAKVNRMHDQPPSADGEATKAAFSTTGKWFAWSTVGVSNRNVLYLWEVGKNKPPAIFDAGDRPVSAIQFNAHDSLMAFANERGLIRLLDLPSQTELLRIHTNSLAVWSLAFSPDDSSLASAGSAGQVFITNLRKHETHVLEGHPDAVIRACFSPDGTMLATAGADSTIRIWPLTKQGEPRVLFGHTGQVNDLAFDDLGRTLFSIAEDQTVRAWNVQDWNQSLLLRGYEGSGMRLAYDSKNRRIVAGGTSFQDTNGDKGWIRTWKFGDFDIVRSFFLSQKPLSAVAFYDERHAVVVGYDQAVRVVDVDGKEPTTTLAQSDGEIYCVAVNLAKKLIAWAGDDSRIYLYDLATKKLDKQFAQQVTNTVGEYWGLSFNADGSLLAAANYDRRVRVFDVGTRQLLSDLPRKEVPGGAIWNVSFGPQKGQLASCGGDRLAKLWNLAKPDSSPLVLSNHLGEVWGLAFNQDGTTLATGSVDRNVALWSTDTGQLKKLLVGHLGTVLSVAFQPSNSILASCSVDSSVRLWDLSANDSITLRRSAGPYWWVAFNPQGNRLAATGLDGTLYVWNLDKINAILAAPANEIELESQRQTGLSVVAQEVKPRSGM